MASDSEDRINLTAVQRVDPTITKIIANASQVALYKYNETETSWERTGIEGAFFVFSRDKAPKYGFIVMNRLNITNQIEVVSQELDFQLQSPFLLYKKATAIHGIWFYGENECTKIGRLLIRLANSTANDKSPEKLAGRQRCASESDSNSRDHCNNQNSAKGIDIVTLLSRAQDQYDMTKSETPNRKHSNSNNFRKDSKSRKFNDIIKPKPLRARNGVIHPAQNMNKSPSTVPTEPLSVEKLFARANEERTINGQKSPEKPQVSSLRRSQSIEDHLFNSEKEASADKILQRLMSNPAHSLEHVERMQRNEAADNVETSSRHRATSCSATMGLASTAQLLEDDLKQKLKLVSKPESQADKKPGAGRNLSGDSSSRTRIPEEFPSPPSPPTMLTPAMLEQSVSLLSQQGRSQSGCSSLGTSPGHVSSLADTFGPTAPSGINQLLSPMAFTKTGEKSCLDGLSPFISLPKPTTVRHAGGCSPEICSSSLDGDPSGLLLAPHTLVESVQKSSVTHLTKEQLKDALVHMIQNDDDFLMKLHEAYVSSLKTKISRVYL